MFWLKPISNAMKPLSIFLISACLISLGCHSPGKLPENANLIPNDAFAVASVDVGKLINQTKLNEQDSVLRRAIWDEMGVEYLDKVFQNLIDNLTDPDTLGIDGTRPILAWAKTLSADDNQPSKKDVVEQYEATNNSPVSQPTTRMLVLENGTVEIYKAGIRQNVGKTITWKKVLKEDNEEFHMGINGSVVIFSIERDGDMALKAIISPDGERQETPDEDSTWVRLPPSTVSEQQEPDLFAGVIIPLSDSEKFVNILEPLLKAADPDFKLETKEGFRAYVKMDMPVAMGIRNSELVVVGAVQQSAIFGADLNPSFRQKWILAGDDEKFHYVQDVAQVRDDLDQKALWEEPLLKILDQAFNKTQSKMQDARLEAFLKQSKDVGFYLNYGVLFKIFSDMMPPDARSDPDYLAQKALLGTAALGVRVFFDTEAASINGVFYHEDIKKDWGGDHNLHDLRGLASDESQFLLGASLNTSKIASYYEKILKGKILGGMDEWDRKSFTQGEKEIKEATGYSVPNLIRILDGNFIGSLSGINLLEDPDIKFTVGANTSTFDKGKSNSLMLRFSDLIDEMKENDGIHIGLTGNRFIVANSDVEETKKNLDKDRFDFLAKHDFAIHAKGGLPALMISPPMFFPRSTTIGAVPMGARTPWRADVPMKAGVVDVPDRTDRLETVEQRRARRIAEEKARAALEVIERKEREMRLKQEQAREEKAQAKINEALNAIRAAMLALDFEDGAIRLSYTLQVSDPDPNKNSLRSLFEIISSAIEMEKGKEMKDDASELIPLLPKNGKGKPVQYELGADGLIGTEKQSLSTNQTNVKKDFGGKVAKVDSELGFVVLSFSSTHLPEPNRRFDVFRSGVMIGRLSITSMTDQNYVVADILSGDDIRVDDKVLPEEKEHKSGGTEKNK